MDRNLLTQEQIRAVDYTNLYDVLEVLRPTWLRARGRDSFVNPSQVVVYSDGIRLGGVEELRSIGSLQVTSIRYYDALQATARWGIDHGQGVIFISSKPR